MVRQWPDRVMSTCLASRRGFEDARLTGPGHTRSEESLHAEEDRSGAAAVALGFLLVTNPVVADAAARSPASRSRTTASPARTSRTTASRARTSRSPRLTQVPTAAKVGGLSASQIQDKASVLFGMTCRSRRVPTRSWSRSRGVGAGGVQQRRAVYDVQLATPRRQQLHLDGDLWQERRPASMATTRQLADAPVGDSTDDAEGRMGVVLWDDSQVNAGRRLDGDQRP